MTTRKSQSGDKKPTSVGDTHEPKPRIGTEEEVCNSFVLGARNSNPIAAGDGRKGGQFMSQPGGEQKNADQTDVKDKEKQKNPSLMRDGSEKIGL